MNNPLVGKHLPLLGGVFSEENCREFLRSKKQLWEEHGIGPWIVLVNNDFAGWGGLQPENGEIERVINEIINIVFERTELKLVAIINHNHGS